MVGSWTMLFSVSFLRPRKAWSLTNSLNLSLNAAFPSRVRNEPWPFSFTPTTNGPYFVPSSPFQGERPADVLVGILRQRLTRGGGQVEVDLGDVVGLEQPRRLVVRRPNLASRGGNSPAASRRRPSPSPWRRRVHGRSDSRRSSPVERLDRRTPYSPIDRKKAHRYPLLLGTKTGLARANPPIRPGLTASPGVGD